MESSEFQVRDLVQACHCFSSPTALGVDQWPPREWLTLPGNSLDGVVQIFNRVEHELMFPTQCLLNIMAMLSKSANDERA
eukprot:6977965-Pyramimonas_sp.AAC.1